MRRYLFMFVLVVAAVAWTGCQEQEIPKGPQANTESEPNDEHLANSEPPLLLDDGPQTDPLDESRADNSRCFVCHVNYMQEDIAVTHARAGIGCADCHGQSDEHIADESWASGGNGTAPDIMYPRLKINPFCIGCHPKDKIDTEPHKPLFADGAEQKYCTDCHGDHRLASRKCRWK